jgi:cell division protein FtsX
MIARIAEILMAPSDGDIGVILIKLLIIGLALSAVILSATVVAIAFAFSTALVVSLVVYFPKALVFKTPVKFTGLLHSILQNALLMIKEIVSQKFISVIVFFAVIISVFCLSIFRIIGDNFNKYITTQFASAIPPNTIKVSPRPVASIGFLRLRQPPGSKLNNDELSRIVRMEGVKAIHPFMSVQIPMRAVVPIFGLRYNTDLVCIGAPYSIVRDDIKPEYRSAWLNWREGREVPVLIPNFLLETYNNSMAEANNLPKIRPETVMETRFEIHFGRSSVRTIQGFIVEKGVLTGFTDGVNTLAVVVPLGTARHYNGKFGSRGADEEYIYTLVEVDSHENLEPVSKRISDKGFIVETEKSVSKEIISLKQNVNTLINSLSAIIIFLAVVAIAFSTAIATLNRMEYYRVLRILGSSKIFISLTIILKYALLGFIGTQISLWVIESLSQTIAGSIEMAGFTLDISLDKSVASTILLYGTLIPVISTSPALFGLYTKGLSRD